MFVVAGCECGFHWGCWLKLFAWTHHITTAGTKTSPAAKTTGDLSSSLCRSVAKDLNKLQVTFMITGDIFFFLIRTLFHFLIHSVKMTQRLGRKLHNTLCLVSFCLYYHFVMFTIYVLCCHYNRCSKLKIELWQRCKDDSSLKTENCLQECKEFIEVTQQCAQIYFSDILLSFEVDLN